MRTRKDKLFEQIARYLAEPDALSEDLTEGLKKTPSGFETAEWKDAKETWKILKTMQEIEQFDTDKAWNNLWERLAKEDMVETTAVKPVYKISKIRIFAVAASLALMLAVAAYLFMQHSTPPMVFANNTAQTQTLILPDSTQVSLNANAHIVLDKDFARSNRKLKMQGEVFFKVKRNEQLPFVIAVQQTQVKVLGTSFNVKSTPNTVEVVVKTGKVEVLKTDAHAIPVYLMPGEQAIASSSGIVKQINKHDNYLAWLDKKLVFKAMPLPEVIQDINAAYHCQIEIGDTQINNLLITATYSQNTIDEILKSITLAFNLKLETQGKKYILVSDTMN